MHPKDQVQKIADSISEYGFTVPLVADGDGVVIMGHGRLMAAKLLEMKTVPCIIRTDLTDEQANGLRIADNRVAEGEYDIDALIAELSSIDSFTGYSGAEIDTLMMAMNDEATDPDKEWGGMPKFDQEDSIFRSVIVHFHDQKGVDDFKAAVNKDFTNQAKYIWYPEIIIDGARGKAYEADQQ